MGGAQPWVSQCFGARLTTYLPQGKWLVNAGSISLLIDKRVLVVFGLLVTSTILLTLAALGLGSAPFTGPSQSIAWQAHIGGFFAGLLLFSFFDPIPPASRRQVNAEDA